MAAGALSQSAVLWATSFPRVSAPSLAASGPPWGGEQPDESDQALGAHAPASPHIPPTQRERLSPHCSSSLQAQKTPLLSQATLCSSPPRCGVTGPCSWQGKEQGFPQGSNAGSVPGGSPTLRLRQDTPGSRCPLTAASCCSRANFSSWEASSFSKSLCLQSSSSTSDTECWGEAGQGEALPVGFVKRAVPSKPALGARERKTRL